MDPLWNKPPLWSKVQIYTLIENTGAFWTLFFSCCNPTLHSGISTCTDWKIKRLHVTQCYFKSKERHHADKDFNMGDDIHVKHNKWKTLPEMPWEKKKNIKTFGSTLQLNKDNIYCGFWCSNTWVKPPWAYFQFHIQRTFVLNSHVAFY